MKTKTNIVFSTKDRIDELEMMQLPKTTGELLFNGNPFTAEVEAVMKNRKYGVDEGKSKSQILRGVIYQLWSTGQIDCDNDEEAYNQKMDQIINHLKSKLQ